MVQAHQGDRHSRRLIRPVDAPEALRTPLWRSAISVEPHLATYATASGESGSPEHARLDLLLRRWECRCNAASGEETAALSRTALIVLVFVSLVAGCGSDDQDAAERPSPTPEATGTPTSRDVTRSA